MSRGTRSTAQARAEAENNTRLAAEVKGLLARGDKELARERFEEIVTRHQRRASRIAYHYLRDAAEVDEVVQDAFVKAFVHLPSFREHLLFELWFTRIVVNGCLDRLKARRRRERWLVDTGGREREVTERHAGREPSPEEALLAQERQARVAAAIGRLPDRQRTVIRLTQFDGRSTREVSAMTGLNESTVRVHLFRAIRALRKHLRGERWLFERHSANAEGTRE